MKRISIFFAAAYILMAASCSKAEFVNDDNNDTQTLRELVPLAISSGDKSDQTPQSKTSLNGTEVHWTDGDCVGVIDKGNYINKFESVSINGSSASFEGLVETGTTDFYAVYPFQSVTSADASNVFVNLPSDQSPSAGTFANNLNLSVAKGSRTIGQDKVEGLTFKNVCGLIQFTVPQRLNAVSKVTFKADNRSLSGDLTLSKSDLQTISEISNGSNTVTMEGNFEAGSTFYFVVAPGDIKGFSISVVTDNGATFSKTSVKTISVEAGKKRNLGVIDFTAEPYASVGHTYESGILTGTMVKVNLGLPTGMEQYITDLVILMRNDEGNLVRKLQKSSANSVEELEVTEGYTYIPQNNYTIAIGYTLNGVKEDKVVYATVPAPLFTVAATATTSYSLYKDGKSGANDMNPDVIKDIAYSVSISDKILSERGLSACSGSITGPATLASVNQSTSGVNTGSSTFYSETSRSGAALGTYSVNASATFDGVTANAATKTIHITGLPFYTPKFETSGEYAWSIITQGTKEYIRFGDNILLKTDGKAPSVSTPEFHIPENINVTLYNKYTKNTGSMGKYAYTVNLYNGSSAGTNIITHKHNKKGTYEFTENTTLTSSYNRMLCKYDYEALGNDVTINDFDITYNY